MSDNKKIQREKIDLLENEGFVFSKKREIYIQRKTKKILSNIIVEDSSIEDLKKLISDKNTSGEYTFYFEYTLNDKIKQEIIEELSTE